MEKADGIAALRTIVALLQKEYQLTPQDIQAALSAESIPATIFTADATPLEAVISYLASTGRDAKTVAKLVGRSKSYVNQVLGRGRKHAEPQPTPYTIPITLLREGAAGATITAHLANSYGLTDKQVAQLLHKDESTVWTWRKRGGQR